MTYANTPIGLVTGQPTVYHRDLRPGFCEPGYLFLSGPLDAVESIPAGAVAYCDWGPSWPIQPYHQQQQTTRRTA